MVTTSPTERMAWEWRGASVLGVICLAEEFGARACGHIGDVVVSWRRNRASAHPLARHEGVPA